MKQFKLTLIRHTTVDVPQGMIYGHTDVPLSASFNDEADKITAQIKESTFDAVYSSPLSRCLQLAQKISSEVISDSRLMELNFGDWEGKFWTDVDQSPEAQHFFADYVHTSCPNGESFAAMIERCREFLLDIKAKNHENVCVVSHGGLIRALKSIIEDILPEEAIYLKIDYGEIVVFDNSIFYE